MLDSTTMLDHILPKLAEQAWGKLVAQLKFVPRLRRWNDPLAGQNASEWRVPKTSGGSAKTRAPSGGVTFEDRTATYETITTQQFYDAFITDESYESSTGIQYLESLIETAVGNVVEKVETHAAQAIATQSGVGTVGTYGSAGTRAHLQTARLSFINNKIPTRNLVAFVSGETHEDLTNISEFSRFDAIGAVPANAFREGIVDRVGGFQILESPYVYSPAANQHANILCDPQQVMYIFPAQNEIGSAQGRTKVQFERDGIRIYLLREPIPGYNGASGITVSVNFGCKAIRTEGVINWRAV